MMPQPPRPMPSHKKHTIKLLAISARLQSMMINEGITPDELVACAMSVKAGYDSVDFKSNFTPPMRKP